MTGWQRMGRQLDLRTGRPVWSAYRAPRVPTAALTRDVRTDVLVVGMGISGAMIADALTEAGHAVMAIDRRGPMLGSTAATTALVQFELDTPLVKLAAMIGKDAAERAWRRSRLAVANLMARIEVVGIDCRLAPRRSLYLAGDVLDADGLAEEGAARRAAGLSARLLDGSDLRETYGLRRDAALESAGNLSLDPRKLTAGLLLAARARGARLYAPVKATDFSHSADGVEVVTAGGPVIRAAHVVLATGYELTDPVPAKRHRIISTWAIATRPQPRAIWPHAAFMWEASDPYLYLRATHDGRVICGGEDEEFTDEDARDALIPEKTARVAAKLAKLLPGIDATPEFAWAGAFGSTTTGMPIIRRLPRKPRMHAVMGYGGNGITFSRLAAEIVETDLAGGTDRDARLFADATN
ncbi:glycine/D-amino acid oxidase-like deaminating enzyme [Amaricoccus macauensis]|uniref:Glycine/D-amino acid oxidase-like deaminating enzyme n=1 Tax=Amaricoccus macauensis TaxID=57001 RepID=A0A840SVJ3_9RHOB|nr:FAD-dependent oxidoreductase [Amaricoccus macauensis]MBB5223293.1 glycine/D-amino acid oxidase-like deaminating enzyme [Amaricoccus macauensis]